MPKSHVVQQGECIASIAYAYGFLPATIWDHPDNAQLKAKRTSGNVLSPGDVIQIPDKVVKSVQVKTGRKHTFRRLGIPEYLRLRLQDADGTPHEGLEYTIDIDGRLRTGRSGQAGLIEESIWPNARVATLEVPALCTKLTIALGKLDPVETLSGVQARLNNLDYPCGEITGQMNEATRAALQSFQKDNGLNPTGEPHEATRQKLLELQGC